MRMILFLLLALSINTCFAEDDYAELLQLFEDWREFESPPLLDGAPDYTAGQFSTRHADLQQYRARLDSFDISIWPVAQQVDWHLIRAEMNGFDFNHRVLQPWVRDPAFYQSIWMSKSDVPGHEGPTHHAVTELWTYDFPLSDDEEQRLIQDLRVITPLMNQAKQNLTGNARDLWITGIRDIRRQRANLDTVSELAGSEASGEFRQTIADAKQATDSLVDWLEQQSASKTGPSGIGKENYTWYQQNVHLVPLTWEDEVRLLRRELERAWSSLKLEEHRNRKLPKLIAASTPEEYAALADRSATNFLRFLRDEDILTYKDYFEPALRAQLGEYVPEDDRHFFWIAAHYDPTPLYTHFYHWFELARMEEEPHTSPVRQSPLLYNIFDSRNEGTATGVEEMFMHAGLYDDNPRVREIVWIMLAQRAARGLVPCTRTPMK